MMTVFIMAASEDSHVVIRCPIQTFENLPVVFFSYMSLFFLYTEELKLLKLCKS